MSAAPLSVADALERARAAYGRGALDECEALCALIMQAEPHHEDATNLAGAVCIGRGDAASALAWFTRATQAHPRSAEGFNNRGVALERLGRLDEAERSYRKALEIAPGHVDALYNLAVVYGAQRRWDPALAAYRRVVQAAPNHALAWNNLGNVLQKLRRGEEALECHRRAIALRPDLVDAWNNCGTALAGLKRFPEALRCYDEALRLRPRHADALINRGAMLREMGDAAASLAGIEAALEADPARSDAYVNRGLSLEEQGRFDAALESYDRAIAMRPGDAEASWNKALLLLLRGDYGRGWPLYEQRWSTPELASRVRRFDFPAWRAEPLEGKSILLYADQGAGDAIQFSRYVPLVEGLGAAVMLETPAPLAALFSSSFPSIEVVSAPPRGRFDFHCALGSLPLAFGTTPGSIPGAARYLRADEARLRRWRERLGATKSRRIGLAWSGNPEHRNDHNRSIALARLAPLLELDAEFHALQREVRAADQPIATAMPRLRLWGDTLGDFSDTAGLIESMDLVISVDTAPAHLAAALGKPTWLLLPKKPDWRWMLSREDSPWYASARLFRQTERGRWEDVVERVRAALG